MMRQVGHFALVGIAATLTHLLVSYALLWALAPSAPVANFLGNLAALPVAYWGHSRLTFARHTQANRFWRFALNNYLLFAASLACSWVLQQLQLNAYLNLTIAVLLIPCISFFLHKYHSFKP